MPDMDLCPYCGQTKDTLEFTDEHVIPRSLGGGLEEKNPFKLRVCKKCNTKCGQHVDGPVSRSPFIKLAHNAVVDLATDPILPLHYLGTLTGWNDPTTVCDFWLGPTGDQIFHFHQPYLGGETMVGGAPGVKTDPGAVFVGVVATNPAWHPIIARSIHSQFKKAPIFTLNAVLHEPSRVPEHLRRKLDWIRHLPRQREMTGAVDLDCGDRLTAKLALGLGAIALGSSFVTSTDAVALRSFLWSQDPSVRAAIPIRRQPLLCLPRQDELVRQFGWKRCHTVVLLPIVNTLALVAVFYGGHAMAIEVTSDPTLWQHSISRGGVAWVIAPGLRRYAGPMLRSEMYIDMKQDTPTGPLADLARRLASAKPLPPFHLPEGSTGCGRESG